MIILSKYDMEQVSERLYYIKCKEYILCPKCGCQFKIIGSRKRKYIDKSGNNVTLIIRRLRCKKCNKIHHELPDILVPYKRYESCVIEDVLADSNLSILPAEESTFYRWKSWFRNLLIRILTNILSKLYKEPKKWMAFNHCRVKSFLKTNPRWLTKLVWKGLYLNLW